MNRLHTAAVGLLLVSLPLGTAPMEIATGLVVLLALPRLFRRGAWGHAPPWLPFAAALAGMHGLSALVSGDLREGLGQAWPLATLFALPLLDPHPRVRELGALAALVGAGWALVQAAADGVGAGGFSHHLTLAYALLPPFAYAVARGRRPVAAALAAGVLATGSTGALVPMFATLLAARWTPPGLAWAGGAAVSVGLLPLALPDDLRQRAILWTAGLEVAAVGPVGAGAYRAAVVPVQDRLDPGFYFPNHAHDSAIQVLATAGWPALVALVGLVATALLRADRAGAAALVGVTLGALTQDTLGDLEVARSAWTWLALAGTAAAAPRSDSPAGEVSR